jgi:hypothetical protein
MALLPRAVALVTAGAGAYVLLVRGDLTLDVGVGRRVRPLGPQRLHIAAPRETVFDVIAKPYLGRTPRAMQAKFTVLERGSDMVLAAHYTPVLRRLTATTVETVRFEAPSLVAFRLVRGPVPCVLETFELAEAADGGTDFTYAGELGTDFWAIGARWGDRVAASWERAVAHSLAAVKDEAERRAGGG